jgi:hypothetical protein
MTNILCLPSHAEAGTASTQSRRPMSSRQTYSSMRHNSRSLNDGDGNVIHFCTRRTPPRRGLENLDMTGYSAVEDLRKYEDALESDDDYCHRMLVNFITAIVVIVLMVTGSWMVDTIISSWPR